MIKIILTTNMLGNIHFNVDDEWLGNMLSYLSETYNPLLMGLKSSAIKISVDFREYRILIEKTQHSWKSFTRPAVHSKPTFLLIVIILSCSK